MTDAARTALILVVRPKFNGPRNPTRLKDWRSQDSDDTRRKAHAKGSSESFSNENVWYVKEKKVKDLDSFFVHEKKKRFCEPQTNRASELPAQHIFGRC